jgi:hypothetical protein
MYILVLLFMFSTPFRFFTRTSTKLYMQPYPASTIVTKNNNASYSPENITQFLLHNPGNQGKKLISISPGGYKGFYMMGVAAYVKKHYDLSNYIYSGASAGAWNSLLMTYQGDISIFRQHITDPTIRGAKSISEMEQVLKRRLLESYSTKDFDLDKLFIGVTTVERGRKPSTTIYTRFAHLEDAIDCCIASSHIPFITGNMTYTYHNLLSFDGGFSKYPYLGFIKPVLHITPGMWKSSDIPANIWKDIHEYTTLFSKDRYEFDALYDQGYRDAIYRKDILDKLLL